MRLIRLCLIASAMLATAMAAPDANDPAAYAVRLPVTVAPGAPLQRILLPPQVLARLRTADHTDLRVFNAQGQALPMAISDPISRLRTEQQSIVVKASPILGAPGRLNVTGVSLQVDDRGEARVVQLDGKVDSAAGTGSVVLGALLDTRRIEAPVVGITLDADVPLEQTISFVVEGSADLKTWWPVGDIVLYRTGAYPRAARSETIKLDPVDLHDRYLRVTWTANPRPLSPIAVRGATLTTARNILATPRAGVGLTGVALEDAHALTFEVPFATPVAAVQVRPVGDNFVMPLRVLGRDDREQSWTPMGSGTVYSMMAGGKRRGDDTIELSGGSYRQVRIEADARAAGFAGVPGIELQFDPVQVIVLVTGSAPFTISAGQAAVPSAYLPRSTLMPSYTERAEDSLPLATVAVAAEAFTLAAGAGDTGASRRALVLWGLLLLGTAALGVMVYVLMRQSKAAT
ncbi:DUF3999 family protein [Glacieibacterium sp.]|uniref:DUF3999 family protein n=1 Tax=Glacieibacterium sp. TaxID=2860237 RepID=UPI003B005998